MLLYLFDIRKVFLEEAFKSSTAFFAVQLIVKLDKIFRLPVTLIKKITIYAPMIYMAPFVMFLMRADTLRGQVGGGWALEMESFLGPVKWHRADKRVPFGAQKTPYLYALNTRRGNSELR